MYIDVTSKVFQIPAREVKAKLMQVFKGIIIHDEITNLQGNALQLHVRINNQTYELKG